MTYLLEVTALIAWWHEGSPHHEVFHRWAAEVGLDSLNTCAISELGFLRVSMQVFGWSAAEAQAALTSMRPHGRRFVAAAPSPVLPPWAAVAAQTTDAYLVQIAAAAGHRLATFDAAVPGAVLIRAD
jgi:predicted nucleic acid-binding protein